MGQATTAATGDPSPETGSSAKPSSPTGRRTGSASSNPAPQQRGGSATPRKPSAAAAKAAKRRRRKAAKLFKFDRELGCRFVAGADEAGRGSLAGPLVAAGVLLDYERLSMRDRRALGDLDDSKQRTAEQREALY
ncbi:MAG: hypothetical protein ACHQJ5_07295, partial [Vicinamibacteria bacterium]